MVEIGIEILVVTNKQNRRIIILTTSNNKKMLKSIFFGILDIVAPLRNNLSTAI